MKKPRKHPAKAERISQRIYEAEQEAMREALKDLVIEHGDYRREEEEPLLGFDETPVKKKDKVKKKK